MEKKNNHPEKRLQEKAEEFYKASSDFNEKEDHWQEFFEELRKILYYAMLFKTPEELIYERIDAEKPLLGVLNKEIERPTEEDLKTARNYLAEHELKKLDNAIENFLLISESQLKAGKSLSIQDWISRLQGLLQMNGYAVLLTHSKISKKQMQEKVKEEFEKFY